MSKDYIIRGTGSSRNSSIQACLRKHGNISCNIKHMKNDVYKILLNFDESEEAAKVLSNAGATIIQKTKRKLIITFTKVETYKVVVVDGMIQLPEEIIKAFNITERTTIQWKVDYTDGITSVHLVFDE